MKLIILNHCLLNNVFLSDMCIWQNKNLIEICFKQLYWYFLRGCEHIVARYSSTNNEIRKMNLSTAQYFSLLDITIFWPCFPSSIMVTAIDEAIGNITKALKTKGMFNYTLIIFTTDVSVLKRRFSHHFTVSFLVKG